jgi:hypothetical protein
MVSFIFIFSNLVHGIPLPLTLSSRWKTYGVNYITFGSTTLDLNFHYGPFYIFLLLAFQICS